LNDIECKFYNFKRVLKKVNINIYGENEKTKSFENIIMELSEIWDKVDEEQKKMIRNAIFEAMELYI